MLRSTLRIPFHVPEHKGFFVKLLFILDSPTFSGRSDPLHQFEVLAAVARVKRPDKGNVCSPPKCNKKVVCPRGSEQTTAQRRNGPWNEKAYFASRTETVTSLASVLKSNAPPSCNAKRISYTFWARSLPEAFSSDQFPVKAWYRPSVPSA